MTILHVGIDEAAYGPTLGPLLVGAVTLELPDGADPTDAFLAAGLRVGDSKGIHRSGNLAPLEAVALAGLRACGHEPPTAAALFALLGEGEERRDRPWMAGLEDLPLPLAAAEIPGGSLPPGAATVTGRVVRPREINAAGLAGENKAALELKHIVSLTGSAVARGIPSRTVCDRLGGRRYYADALRGVARGAAVEAIAEERGESRYRLTVDGVDHEVAFLVGGESRSPLVALASCVAKYARELAMHRFNEWWVAERPGLKPTAGYPEDARRWLEDVGAETVAELGMDLVRGYEGPSLFG